MRLFVTGTDTDVGKTVVTACLARAAREQGTIVAVKPVASGVPAGTPGADAALLGWAAGHRPEGWVTFGAPLSPHRAAALEGRAIPDDLLERVAALRADTVLVEGVGGWRVPLRLVGEGAAELWVPDLARAVGGPVLVVAPDRIGVLNQVLLTVDAIRHDGLPVLAVVLNRGAAAEDPSRTWNADDLRGLLDVPVVPMPPVDLADDGAVLRAGRDLARAILAGGGER